MQLQHKKWYDLHTISIGLIVFLIYISFILKLTINFKTILGGYADDGQSYIYFRPTPDGLNNALREKCVKIIRQFLLTHNFFE